MNDIADIEDRLKAATEWHPNPQPLAHGRVGYCTVLRWREKDTEMYASEANVRFLMNAPDDIRTLLNRIHELEAPAETPWKTEQTDKAVSS
jgi:hypothetical protein